MLKKLLLAIVSISLLMACSKDEVPFGVIAGRVLDQVDNTPVANAEITFQYGCFGVGGSDVCSFPSLFTDENGFYQFVIPIQSEARGGQLELPSRAIVKHPGFCDLEQTDLQLGNTEVSELNFNLKPPGYARITAENTGAYSGEFETVNISIFGSASVVPGSVQTLVVASCPFPENFVITVFYRDDQSVLVHTIEYPLNFIPRDTVDVQVNY